MVPLLDTRGKWVCTICDVVHSSFTCTGQNPVALSVWIGDRTYKEEQMPTVPPTCMPLTEEQKDTTVCLFFFQMQFNNKWNHQRVTESKQCFPLGGWSSWEGPGVPCRSVVHPAVPLQSGHLRYAKTQDKYIKCSLFHTTLRTRVLLPVPFPCRVPPAPCCCDSAGVSVFVCIRAPRLGVCVWWSPPAVLLRMVLHCACTVWVLFSVTSLYCHTCLSFQSRNEFAPSGSVHLPASSQPDTWEVTASKAHALFKSLLWNPMLLKGRCCHILTRVFFFFNSVN